MGKVISSYRWLSSSPLSFLTRPTTYILFAVAVVMWLQFLVFPFYVADGDDLDGSWSHAFGYFARNGSQAGKDYIFTYGILGYFSTKVYDAGLFWYRYAWESVVKCVFAIVIMKSVSYLPGFLTRLFFCATLVIFI